MKEINKKEKAMAESQNSKTGGKGKKIVVTVLNSIINILIVAVLLISIFVAAVALTSKSDPNGVPNLFGYTIEYVQTNSMNVEPPEGYEGGNFSDQDVIICKVYSKKEFPDIEVGDIVTFRSNMTDEDGNTALITHRIVEKKDIDGNTVYRTKGDAGTEIDQQKEGEYLLPSNIVSVFYCEKYHGKILRGFADFFRTIRSQKGFFIFILIPMIAFFLYAIIRVIISAMNYRKDKTNEEKQEAVDAAVAAALAAKDEEKEEKTASPSDMTPEQMEQFKAFLAQQEAQKAGKAPEDDPAEDKQEESPEE